MPVIDEELEKTHAKEERKRRFVEFVKEQKAAGKKGMENGCLQTEGYRDFFGQAEFTGGRMFGHWILPADKNGKALLFKEEKAAKAYAKDLEKALKDNGYPKSKAWAEQVTVRNKKAHPYSILRAPTYTFETEERYLIRMKVK